MDYRDFLWAAAEQSAREFGCAAEDFLRPGFSAFASRVTEGARVYCRQPFLFEAVTYGPSVVVSCREDLLPGARELLGQCDRPYDLFEPAGLSAVNRLLSGNGGSVRFASHCFLPDPEAVSAFRGECPGEVRILGPEGFAPYYSETFSNALCEKRREYDRLAAGAFDGERLVGLAGISEDCPELWQLGIDVVPEYRGRGIGPALVNRLTREVLGMGKIPFYGASWANVRSLKTAERAGYRMAWTAFSAGF